MSIACRNALKNHLSIPWRRAPRRRETSLFRSSWPHVTVHAGVKHRHIADDVANTFAVNEYVGGETVVPAKLLRTRNDPDRHGALAARVRVVRVFKQKPSCDPTRMPRGNRSWGCTRLRVELAYPAICTKAPWGSPIITSCPSQKLNS
jgi:hypothetical protein